MKFKTTITCGLVSFWVCGGGGEWARGGIAPMELRCEYATNSLGIDTAHPRFSWKLVSRQRGQMQAAYQILAASSEADLSANKGDLWDSGKVNSDQSTQILYAGKALESGVRYYWKVRVWGQDGKHSTYSDSAWWEMGLLKTSDWTGKWIEPVNEIPVVKEWKVMFNNKPPEPVPQCAFDGFDDSSWSVLIEDPLKTQTGYAWYRTRINAKNDEKRNLSPQVLHIEALQNLWVFVNGKLIAESVDNPYYSGCALALNIAPHLKEGDNLISLCIQRADDHKHHPGGLRTSVKTGVRDNLFRKEFTLNRKIKRARAFIAGLGYYELRINGEKIGDHVLDPGWTAYKKTVLYVVYDVTDQLKKGKNAVGVMLGKGHRLGTTMLMQMNIEFTDATSMSVVSDGTWKSASGPIIAHHVFNGETYDARLEKDGWDKAGYDDSGWNKPKTTKGPGGALVSQVTEPIKVIKSITPVKITNPKPGVYVYDMGQNFAGWARLSVKGDCGTRVVMKFAEDIHKDGMIDPTTNRAAKNTDIYTLKGKGMEVYEPRFAYHGFRYVEVTGFPGVPKRENLQGCVVHSAVESVGEFACSNPLINQIHRNILWGLTSNFYSVLTDCPQRDERAGWLECGHLLAEGAMFNFNMAGFYTKWITDMSDSQNEEGSLPPQTPYAGWAGWPGDPAWASSMVLSPWHLYNHYGDTRILETHYEAMQRWVDFLGRKSENHIVTYNVFGDWATPSNFETPGDLISTAFYYYCTTVMEKSSRILGKTAQADNYADLAKNIGKAFNDEFLYALPAELLLPKAASTTLPPAGDNVVENLIDDDPETIFWSSKGPKSGDKVTIDLGEIKQIKRIMIPFRGYDFFYEGKLQYSLDGENFTDIADIGSRFINKSFSPTPMRYIRILSTKEQIAWICMLDFKAFEDIEEDQVSRYQYVTGSQLCSAFPLFLGIVPDAHKEGVLNDLVHNVMVDHDGHLGIGEVGLKFLIEALTDNGRADVVYAMATKTTYPSWGDIINKGFTTLIEMWDGTGSHNHIMWGTIDEWFYKALAGIDLAPEAPGYKKIIIKPRVVGDLTWAKGSVNTIRGKVASSWEKKGNSLTLNVTIPANSTAKIYVPKIDLKQVKVTESGKIIWKDGSYVGSVAGITAGYENESSVIFVVGSGSYHFKVILN